MKNFGSLWSLWRPSFCVCVPLLLALHMCVYMTSTFCQTKITNTYVPRGAHSEVYDAEVSEWESLMASSRLFAIQSPERLVQIGSCPGYYQAREGHALVSPEWVRVYPRSADNTPWSQSQSCVEQRHRSSCNFPLDEHCHGPPCAAEKTNNWKH